MTELFMAHPAAAEAFQAGLHRAPDCERLLAKAAHVLAAVVDRVQAAEAAGAAEAADVEGQARAQGDPSLEGAPVVTGSGSGWCALLPNGTDSAWSLRSSQPQSQTDGSVSRWASRSHRPQAGALQQQASAGGHVSQLAAVLDLSQATFAPVVTLFEGCAQKGQCVCWYSCHTSRAHPACALPHSHLRTLLQSQQRGHVSLQGWHDAAGAAWLALRCDGRTRQPGATAAPAATSRDGGR